MDENTQQPTAVAAPPPYNQQPVVLGLTPGQQQPWLPNQEYPGATTTQPMYYNNPAPPQPPQNIVVNVQQQQQQQQQQLVVVKYKQVNHCCHCCLTFWTGGLWLPCWILGCCGVEACYC
ncbi:unnamed protein product [Didymodactylos carnosus]|uniref:Uncharacterized protein n=1 Tax=Didymodactylos carnosus TaxID=1234261 RepID=A0A814LRD3_9BILA|nr:unnamed protein product [Didymodactylos carnosus]CAF1233826.1 unnamed protein product [Didymodactylos carnosus]CAF3836026.1 unnamed protein product [Didymodactylos carnosus]CAF4042002.1 unnamed protein product [Didymodactylos carnosus]